LRLDREWHRAGRNEGVPDVFAGRGGEVELVAEFAHEPDPHRKARHPARTDLPCVQVPERLGRHIVVVRRLSASRAPGPATFTAASAPVTLTISASYPQTAFHHSNHSHTLSEPVEVVVT